MIHLWIMVILWFGSPPAFDTQNQTTGNFAGFFSEDLCQQAVTEKMADLNEQFFATDEQKQQAAESGLKMVTGGCYPLDVDGFGSESDNEPVNIPEDSI